jgi:hypothetical protein
MVTGRTLISPVFGSVKVPPGEITSFTVPPTFTCSVM